MADWRNTFIARGVKLSYLFSVQKRRSGKITNMQHTVTMVAVGPEVDPAMSAALATQLSKLSVDRIELAPHAEAALMAAVLLNRLPDVPVLVRPSLAARRNASATTLGLCPPLVNRVETGADIVDGTWRWKRETDAGYAGRMVGVARGWARTKPGHTVAFLGPSEVAAISGTTAVPESGSLSKYSST